MPIGQSGSRSSLLDALDNSFYGRSSPGADVSFGGQSSSSSQTGTATVFDAEDHTGSFDHFTSDGPVRAMPSFFVSSRDFRLNYDTETPLKSIDVGGPDQEKKLSEFVSTAIDNASHGLTVQTALEKLGLRDKRDLLPGLEVRLLPHQAIGVAWMLEQENGKHRGGILADDMGLGKTVQMIATMAGNLPAAEDEYRTSLIVVPAALLQQWKDEVESKTNGLFSVHIHHGTNKLKTPADIKSKDIIITSYQTLLSDFTCPEDVEESEELNWLTKYGGPLARTKFYRAIADEAQFIRNRRTRASISLAYVRAKYRWLLTGTPVTNTLADLYGLLRFGRFRPWNDWDKFNSHIASVQQNDALLAGTRAQAILKPLLLRRTKDSEIEGVPILQLPPKDIELVALKFSKDERELYDSFEERSKIIINRFIRSDTLFKFHTEILVLILRLRQLCCHPSLTLHQAEGLSDPTLLVAGESERELGRARKTMGASWVTEVKKRFLLRKAANELEYFDDNDNIPGASSCPKCQEILLADNGRILSCGHEICFDCALTLKNSAFVHDGIFGYGDEKQNIEVEKAYGAAQTKGWRPCPTCGKMVDLGPQKTFKWAAFEPTDQELADYTWSRKEEKRKLAHKSRDRVKKTPPTPIKTESSKGTLELSDSDDDLPDFVPLGPPVKRRKKGIHEPTSDDNATLNKLKPGRVGGSIRENDDDGDDGPSDALIKVWARADEGLIPSTKMLEMIRLLKEWEATGDKTIIYSQWTSMLDLIEILLSRHGIDSTRFDGRMDKASRDETLHRFKQPGKPMVILISTRCGSVGLNLVAANRVINMELSWNYAAESQAYDRCHRIGQEKDVFVKRLVVENTIEERMLKLQEVKMGLANAALGEGGAIKLGKLSVKDIKYLFGMTPKPGQNIQFRP